MKKPLIIASVVVVIIGVALVYWFAIKPSNTKQPVTKPSPQAQNTPPPAPPSYVDQLLAKMTLRDKVAGLFVLHTSTTSPTALANYMATYKPGGLIFMGDNIPMSFADLRSETSALITDKQLPTFIATDEEGNTVKRLASDTYPGGIALANQPANATQEAFAKRSGLLKDIGINLNFGIIADVTADPSSFIYPRVLGTTPQAASDRVAQAVIGSKGQTLSTIKHFPGHGETGGDSHTSIPTATTAFADWQQRVALPFKTGIDAGADMVMFGHLRYSAVDSQPATLSKKWHDIIRNDLAFKGLIITDDMIMLQDSGDAAYADPVANAIAALQAGNDLLLYVLDHGGQTTQIDPNTLIDGVVAAVNNGTLDQAVIQERIKHVLAARNDMSRTIYGQ